MYRLVMSLRSKVDMENKKQPEREKMCEKKKTMENSALQTFLFFLHPVEFLDFYITLLFLLFFFSLYAFHHVLSDSRKTIGI